MTDLEFSQKTKQEAGELLATTNVLEILKPVGDVRVGGSYELDLMWGPDIDITVAAADPRKASIAALEKFVADRKFQKYQYGDFVAHPREGRPGAYIVVLLLPFAGRKWEIEIWFYEQHPEERVKLAKEIATLALSEREKILRLKRERDERGDDKHKLSSYEIYRKVVDGSR